MTQRYLQQPGVASEPRIISLPCSARRVTLRLEKGKTVLAAVAQALAAQGSASAIIEMAAIKVEPLIYVVPAESPDTTHVAWYSDRHAPKGVGQIDQATVSFGRDGDSPFIHCHGLWTHADGHRGGGHLIPDATVLAEDATVTAFMIGGALFDRLADPETNFPLPTPVVAGAIDTQASSAALLRVKPNQDIHAAIEAEAARHRITSGTIHGVCSFVGCDFADGRQMSSFASEAFIRRGRLQNGKAMLDISATAIGGVVHDGEMVRGGNITCIANEILIMATH